MSSYLKLDEETHMRSNNFTYVNNGSVFVFRADKMTRHPHKARGATMLQVHAILTLEAQEDGHSADLLDSDGHALTTEELEYCARTGNCPEAAVA